MTTLEREILENFRRLSPHEQEKVAIIVRQLARPQGASGASLLQFVGRIAEDDLQRIEQAVESFEQIEPDSW
jgi:hypothetical protein